MKKLHKWFPKMVILRGNHDERIKLKAIEGGIEDIAKLIARHEPLGGGVHVAHNSVVKAGCSVIFGHVHRIQESQVVMIDGSNHRGISAGWLGNKDHSVMNYVKNHHQWSLGFALVTVQGKEFFCDLKHIINYKVLHNGKIVEG